MSLALSFILLAVPARAGQWTVRYSGSTVGPGTNYTFTNNQVTGPPPFNMIPPNGFTLGSGLNLTTTAPSTATLTVTTTLTWTPSYQGDTSVPPSTVGVIETSSASASIYWANPTGVQQQTADDGFSDGPVLQTPPMYGASSSGSHFTLVSVPAGSTSVTLPNMRTVTTTLGCVSNQGGNGSGGASLVYSAAPVMLILAGTTPDSSGNQNILVGQGCTASLSALPPGLTASNYKWSVSGTTFQSWSAITPQIGTTPANPNASYEVDGYGPATNPTAHWYWDDVKGAKTVSCTATVTPPSGQGAAFPVTITQNVNLVVPQVTENPTVGRVQINTHPPSAYGTSPTLYAGGTGTSQPYGIIYTTQVLTPALFASPSSGLWDLVQGVAPNFWTTLFPELYQTPDPINGQSGLDGHYPLYPWTPGSSPSFPTGIVANNLMAQPYDGPGTNLSNTKSRYRVSESFLTYIFYLPPGNDSQWVPVWLVAWHWVADDTAPLVSGQPAWSTWNDANAAGTIAVDSSASTPKFPHWTQIIAGQ